VPARPFDRLGCTLKVGENGAVPVVLDEPFEVYQGVGQGHRHPPPALPAVQQAAKLSVIGRVGQLHVELGTRGAALDPKIKAAAQRVCPNEREAKVGDESVDFIELLLVAGQPRADHHLAADGQLRLSLGAARATQK